MNFCFLFESKFGFKVKYSNVILLNTAFIAYYYGKMKEDVLFRDILFFYISGIRYSANTPNSAPLAKSAPVTSLRAVKRT